MADAILRRSGIYAIRNLVTGKCYIGSAVDIGKRWREHKGGLAKGTHHSLKLQHAWSKYGGGVFCFEVLEVVFDKSQLLAREQYWLDFWELCGAGSYNIQPNAGRGCLGMTISEETRAKTSASLRGKKHSADRRANAVISHLGQQAWDKGLKRGSPSVETRRKQCQAMTGFKHSAESIVKMSVSQKGHSVSAKQRADISATLTGKPWSLARQSAYGLKWLLA